MADVARPEITPRVVPLGRSGSVWVAGAGDRLLLLHGWGLQPGVYTRGLMHLAGQGFEVAAPTMAVVGRQWSIERAVHRAHKAMHALDWQRATVVGNSLGGAVAIALAAEHDAHVDLLVLVNSLGLSLERNMLAWLLPFRRYLTAANLRAATAFGRNLVAGGGVVNLASAALYARSAQLADKVEAVRQNGTPAAVLWGEQDRLLPIEMGRELAIELHAPLRVVPGADHDWPVRYPELFAREVEIVIRETRGHRGGAAPSERGTQRRRVARRETGAESREG